MHILSGVSACTGRWMSDRTVFNDISLNLMKISSAGEVYRYVGDAILSGFGFRSVCLLSAFSGDEYEVVFRESSTGNSVHCEGRESHAKIIGAGSDILRAFDSPGRTILRNSALFKHNHRDLEVIEEFRGLLNLHSVDAVIPVFLGSRLVMFFVLGEKASGEQCTEDDVALLKLLSLQTSVTLKGIMLHEEKVNSERLASIGLMSAAFAHELRNTLTPLKTFAQLIPENYDDPEFRDKFSRIIPDQIQRIDGLIFSLLDISTKGLAAAKERINLIDTIDRTIASVAGSLNLPGSNITIERNFGNHEIFITGNDGMIGQAMANIMQNGCQAMVDGGTLSVDVTAAGLTAEVLIKDTGTGIPDSEVAHIFEPFYSTKPSGTGFGLAISRRIIDDHAGDISVESGPGRGTLFRISLPLENSSSCED